MNVVHLRDQSPPINDIVGMLRKMADDLEKGAEDAPDFALLLLPSSEGWPKVFGYGNVPNGQAIIGELELAKAFFVHNITARQ